MKICNRIIVLLLAMMLLLTACQTGQGQTTPTTQGTQNPTQGTQNPTQSTPPATASTGSTAAPTQPVDLEMWNELFGQVGSWYNQALLCTFSHPSQLDLWMLFYNGFEEESKEPTPEEWAELENCPGFDSNYDLIRLPERKVEHILLIYFGITSLEDVEAAGFENLVHLESTDCYYHMVTGAMAVENFQAVSAEELEDGSIRVTYTKEQGGALWVVTLRPIDGGYWILSNLPA